MDDDKYLITDIVMVFKKEPTKENYKKVVSAILENADHSFCMPVDIRLDKNALELKSSSLGNKSWILAYSSPEQMAGRRDSETAMMSIEHVVKKCLSSDYFDGIWINPDPYITPDNVSKQCLISKDDLIKTINKLFK